MKGIRPTTSPRQRRRKIKTERRLEAVRAENIAERWRITREAISRQQSVIDAVLGAEAKTLLGHPDEIRAAGDRLIDDRDRSLELACALHLQGHNIARAVRVAIDSGHAGAIEVCKRHYDSCLALYSALHIRWRFEPDEIPCADEDHA